MASYIFQSVTNKRLKKGYPLAAWNSLPAGAEHLSIGGSHPTAQQRHTQRGDAIGPTPGLSGSSDQLPVLKNKTDLQ